MVKQPTAHDTESPASITLKVIIFAALYLAGGLSALGGSFDGAAIAFAFGAVFASISTPWKELPIWARLIVSISAIAGVGLLIAGIILN